MFVLSSIFSNGDRYLMGTINATFALNWLAGFREDFYKFISWKEVGVAEHNFERGHPRLKMASWFQRS